MRHLHALAKSFAVVSLAAAALTPLAMAAGLVPTAVSPATAASSAGTPGYWLVGSNGGIYQEGPVNYGGLRGVRLAQPVVGGSSTDDGLGYWMVASDGGIFSYGDADFYGSTGGVRLNRPIVGMAADPGTSGYWLVASDGGIFSYDAPFEGSTGGVRLNQPVVGMAPTPSGHGYWLVASDGGIFAFGDARFFGSTGAVHLSQPIVGMAATPDGGGYWLVASDGGIFAFGDAHFYGSTGGVHLDAPVVGMQANADGDGYWLAARDGGVFTFGDAPFVGSAGTNGSPPIVGIMATQHGYPFPPGATGYDVSQWQCSMYNPGSSLPPNGSAVAIAQVSGGALNQAQPQGCYTMEANWAGPNLSAYIYMNPLPATAPQESLTGPAGNCDAGNLTCESYNFGFYWAQYWVNYARDSGTSPSQWWLDVETTNSGWNLAPSAQPANAQVIAGAVAGLQSKGVSPGIYSTHLQWGEITGYRVNFANIPLWVPGAGTLANAATFCTSPDPDHAPFAGGHTVLVQYGYGVSPAPQFDQDYACV
jgi:hypothetical protein